MNTDITGWAMTEHIVIAHFFWNFPLKMGNIKYISRKKRQKRGR